MCDFRLLKYKFSVTPYQSHRSGHQEIVVVRSLGGPPIFVKRPGVEVSKPKLFRLTLTPKRKECSKVHYYYDDPIPGMKLLVSYCFSEFSNVVHQGTPEELNLVLSFLNLHVLRSTYRETTLLQSFSICSARPGLVRSTQVPSDVFTSLESRKPLVPSSKRSVPEKSSLSLTSLLYPGTGRPDSLFRPVSLPRK